MNLRKLALTIQYVTSIPIDVSITSDDPNAREVDLEGLAKYLPWAGYVISLTLAITAYILVQLTNQPLLIGTVLTVLWLCITGGIHMDGLMDSADGIFSHQPREKMLEIMQDSRVGNFGVLSGLVVFMIKLVSLVCLSSHPLVLIPLLIIVPIASRWCELFAIGKFNYAKDTGSGKIWHDSTKIPQDFVFGSIPLVLAGSVLIFFVSAKLILTITFLTLVSGLISAYRLNQLVDGHTGDTYGATVEISEAIAILATAILLSFLV